MMIGQYVETWPDDGWEPYFAVARSRAQAMQEPDLLRAVVELACNYLTDKTGALDSLAISAGEEALEVLDEYGCVQLLAGGRPTAEWTDSGIRMFS